MIIQIENPIIGKIYFFYVYIKSEHKEIRMKSPLKIMINIINEKEKQGNEREIKEKEEREKREKAEKEKKGEKIKF